MNKLQASRQYAKENDHIPDGSRNDLSNAFLAGVEFANEWIETRHQYPPYYKTVNVMYEHSGYDYTTTYDNVTTCWLAVNDDGEYIWTVSGTNVVLMDKVVRKWKYIDVE